jgi:hypothetical protein
LKTLTQFNKNDCYIIESGKSHALKENLYPKTPYVIPNEESLNSRKLHLDKIEVDDLFSDDMIRKTTGGSYDSEEKVTDQKVDKENTNPNMISKEKESMFSMMDQGNQMKKKWFLMAPNSMTFGPYSSEEIYVFIKNMNMKSPEETQIQKYMVVDSESDIYYKPEIIIEQLESECRDKIKPMDPKKELEKIVITKKKSFGTTSGNLENSNQQHFINNAHNLQVNFQPQFLMRERKLSDNPNKLITKYDVFEMNSRFKHAQYLPIKQLKQQLKSIKQNKEEENINNRNNIGNLRRGSFEVQHSAKFGTFKNNNYAEKKNRRYSYDEDLLSHQHNFKPAENKMKLVSIKETLFD